MPDRDSHSTARPPVPVLHRHIWYDRPNRQDGPHTCQHCVGSDQGLPLSAPAFIQQLEATIPAESLLLWNYFKKGFAYEYYTEKQKICGICTLPGSARSSL